MRNILLQIGVAVVLVLAVVVVWQVSEREPALAAGGGVPGVADQPEGVVVKSRRSTLPDVLFIDPAGFLPEALCRVVSEPRVDVTLREAAEEVGDVSGLPCRIEESELADEVLSADEIVTLPAAVPLYMAIDQMCGQHAAMDYRGLRSPSSGRGKLDWYLQDGIIVFTSEMAAYDRLSARAFEGAAVQTWNGDWQGLIDVLQNHVEAEWVDIDGVGGEINIAGNALMVRQTFPALREVAALLDAMQRRAETIYVDHAPADAAIFAVLEQPVNGWFSGVPLDTAVASLAEQTGVPITISTNSLAEEGLSPDDVVNCELRDQPLRLVLDAMLYDIDGAQLGYCVKDGQLEIITMTELMDQNETVFYHVEDLLSVMHNQELIDTVQSQTSGEWIDIDGIGGEIDVIPSLYLIVTGTHFVHQEVQELLEDLRGAVYIPNASDPNLIVSRTYRLSSTLAEDLEPALRQLVAPESWEDPFRLGQTGEAQVYTLQVDADHTTLVIHQTVDNHRLIERLLDRIDPHGYGHETPWR